MDVNNRVKIVKTNDIWQDKNGIIVNINDDNLATVLVDFDTNKKIKQLFSLDNLTLIEKELDNI